jgi:hypothetical protein
MQPCKKACLPSLEFYFEEKENHHRLCCFVVMGGLVLGPPMPLGGPSLSQPPSGPRPPISQPMPLIPPGGLGGVMVSSTNTTSAPPGAGLLGNAPQAVQVQGLLGAVPVSQPDKPRPLMSIATQPPPQVCALVF